MNQIVYQVKDRCRRNLANYTLRAFSFIPQIKNPVILDAGCGTGVPSLALIVRCDGTIYAVDPDLESLEWFEIKIHELGLNDRIKIIHGSILDPSLFSVKFDIILAEGLLNIIGFEKGLQILMSHSKKDGYLIIHDELKNNTKKRKFFKKEHLELIHSFRLGPEVWWNDYYDCLEAQIIKIKNESLFANELKEINDYKNDPTDFKSVYYVLKNTN